MPTPRLSARLQQLAEWVLPGRPVADVGCDHALLPIWLVQQGRVPFALAMDVSEDAVASARTLVERTPGLGGRVQVSAKTPKAKSRERPHSEGGKDHAHFAGDLGSQNSDYAGMLGGKPHTGIRHQVDGDIGQSKEISPGS